MKAPKAFEILKGGTVPLLVAFVGLAGGVIGSFVGPYLTAQHQTAKDITDRRVAVHRSFLPVRRNYCNPGPKIRPKRIRTN